MEFWMSNIQNDHLRSSISFLLQSTTWAAWWSYLLITRHVFFDRHDATRHFPKYHVQIPDLRQGRCHDVTMDDIDHHPYLPLRPHTWSLERSTRQRQSTTINDDQRRIVYDKCVFAGFEGHVDGLFANSRKWSSHIIGDVQSKTEVYKQVQTRTSRITKKSVCAKSLGCTGSAGRDQAQMPEQLPGLVARCPRQCALCKARAKNGIKWEWEALVIQALSF